MSSWRAAGHARHLADSNEVLSCVRCRHIPKEKLRVLARSSRRRKSSSAALLLLTNGERCTDEGAARALDSDQDRDHGIPISLCCRMRMVVVTGSTFEILGFFFFPASRESRDSTALGKSLRGAARRAVATERSTFEFKNRRPLFASRLRRSRWAPHRRRPTKRSVCRLVRELLCEGKAICKGFS